MTADPNPRIAATLQPETRDQAGADVGRIAYEARFAGSKPRDVLAWDKLPADARAVWERVERAGAERLSAELAEATQALTEALTHAEAAERLAEERREALRTIATWASNVLFNGRQRPADHEVHLRVWGEVERAARSAISDRADTGETP